MDRYFNARMAANAAPASRGISLSRRLHNAGVEVRSATLGKPTPSDTGQAGLRDCRPRDGWFELGGGVAVPAAPAGSQVVGVPPKDQAADQALISRASKFINGYRSAPGFRKVRMARGAASVCPRVHHPRVCVGFFICLDASAGPEHT